MEKGEFLQLFKNVHNIACVGQERKFPYDPLKSAKNILVLHLFSLPDFKNGHLKHADISESYLVEKEYFVTKIALYSECQIIFLVFIER